MKPTTVASPRLETFSAYLARRRPARRRPGSASHARRHARASSEGRASEALVPESIETTSGSSKGSAAIPLAGVSGTAPGSCIVVPPPRHQKTGRVSSRQLLHSTFASTVQTSAAPHHQARSSVGSFAPPHVDGLLGPGRALSGCRGQAKGPSWQHAGASTRVRPLGEASLRLRNRRFRRVVNPVHDSTATSSPKLYEYSSSQERTNGKKTKTNEKLVDADTSHTNYGDRPKCT